jgi:acetyltransferase-like isoleucine patch superfamily enzyme
MGQEVVSAAGASRRRLTRSKLVTDRVKPLVRRVGYGVAQRVLGRELTYLDFERLVDKGIVTLGRHTWARPMVHYYEGQEIISRLRIGSFCSIANNSVFIIGSEHPMQRITTYPLRHFNRGMEGWPDGPYSKGDVVVGNDVWVGGHAIVLSGVEVGHGAVIGAGAVVASDVRPYAIVVGNPAREVRRRFSDPQVDALLRIRWWDWPEEKILANADLLCSEDVDGFIERFDTQDG